MVTKGRSTPGRSRGRRHYWRGDAPVAAQSDGMFSLNNGGLAAPPGGDSPPGAARLPADGALMCGLRLESFRVPPGMDRGLWRSQTAHA